MAMSDEHKAALALGRKESRAVKAYLEALSTRKPGRPVTPDSVRQRITAIDARIADEADALKKLELHQDKLNAEDTLNDLKAQEDIGALESEFIDVAKSYSERKGISYTAWRQSGVSAQVLKSAGVPRTRRS